MAHRFEIVQGWIFHWDFLFDSVHPWHWCLRQFVSGGSFWRRVLENSALVFFQGMFGIVQGKLRNVPSPSRLHVLEPWPPSRHAAPKLPVPPVRRRRRGRRPSLLLLFRQPDGVLVVSFPAPQGARTWQGRVCWNIRQTGKLPALCCCEAFRLHVLFEFYEHCRWPQLLGPFDQQVEEPLPCRSHIQCCQCDDRTLPPHVLFRRPPTGKGAKGGRRHNSHLGRRGIFCKLLAVGLNETHGEGC